jgi:hypothetical protein
MARSEQPSEADVQAALDQYADKLMAYPNVNGLGIQEEALPDGRTEPVLQVYVSKKLPREKLDPATIIPKQVVVTRTDKDAAGPRQMRVNVRVQETGAMGF